MSIVKWQDVVDRYRKAADFGGANFVGSSYLEYAEAELNSRLGQHFTVPFSSNNLTAKDLIIDITYARMYEMKDVKQAEFMRGVIDKRIEDLKNGVALMMTNSGDTVSASNVGGGTVWSNTQNYVPTFGMLDEVDQMIDDDLLDDEYADREYDV